MSTPQIPPRPARSQEQQSSSNSLGADLPTIPARPSKRIERSQSPGRESYARSPLNEPSYIPGSLTSPRKAPGFYSSAGANASSSSLGRPASVVLPSLGQEGNEYAEYPSTEDLSTSPSQVRVANDLKLHAPMPSLPVDSAKKRISAVTRTDSDHAASFGIGQARKEPPSMERESSSLSINDPENPQSSAEEEHGIPVHGQRVPMYPNAGDVQAPSPSPYNAQFPVGIGFHNDGTKPRHHGRRASGRGFEAPPGSYGLHGHGANPTDRFERAYYEKHPEMLRKETPHYQEERAGWAMSSEDLNKIVRETASRGSGMGTTGNHIGGPSEQIGFIASEEYASRRNTPRPGHKKTSSVAQDSPLRREESISQDPETHSRLVDEALVADQQNEAEDDDVVHVDAPDHRINKIYGGAGHVDSTEDLGPGADNGGYRDEHGYGAPILASDELAKEPFGYELQPAVSPIADRHSSQYDGGHDLGLYRTRSGQSSQSTARPTNAHALSNVKQGDYDGRSTPLEDLEEYEPLFPVDDKRQGRATTAADKLKTRPDMQARRFPSQDVWEDGPASLNYTTTVEHEQDEPAEVSEDVPNHRGIMKNLKVREGETAAQTFARQQEELAERESQTPTSFLHPTSTPVNPTKNEHAGVREVKKPMPWEKSATITSESRPNMKQRFPSRDVWEDTADSLMLQTTVSGPQSEADILSPAEERPTTGAAVFHQEKAAAGIPLAPGEGRATTGIAATMAKPTVPVRPVKARPQVDGTSPVEARAKPEIPTSSKPIVPARPTKPLTRQDSSEGAPLTKEISAGSDTSASGKVKPAVPSRPMGSKIAALQGGFMADLNKRLGLGPQQPKKEVEEEKETEIEKAPLEDARKGRARGPQRRAPAKAAAVQAPSTAAATSFAISTSTVWAIHPEGTLYVSQPPVVESAATSTDQVTIESDMRDAEAEQPEVPALTTNIAGEAIHTSSEGMRGTSTTVEANHTDADARAAQDIADRKQNLLSEVDNQDSMPTKISDDIIVSSEEKSRLITEGEEEEEMEDSTATLKARDNASI